MGGGVACSPALASSRTFSPQLPPLQKTQPLRAGLRNAGPSALERRDSSKALGYFPSNACRGKPSGRNGPSKQAFPAHSERRGAATPQQETTLASLRRTSPSTRSGAFCVRLAPLAFPPTAPDRVLRAKVKLQKNFYPPSGPIRCEATYQYCHSRHDSSGVISFESIRERGHS